MAGQTGTTIRLGGDGSQPAGRLPHVIAHLVRVALSAPSVQGKQPCRFRYRAADRTIEFRADAERSLARSDRVGRGAHLGTGAALFNLRLAAAWMGWEPVGRLLPQPDDPLLLATLRLAGPHRPSASERELYAAITQPQPAPELPANRAVPGTVLAELAVAARTEGATLQVLHPGEAREPPVAVLSTQFRARAGWLRAGQAMARVLLLASVRGVPVRQLEDAAGWHARHPRSDPEQPQVILRLGQSVASAHRPGDGKDRRQG